MTSRTGNSGVEWVEQALLAVRAGSGCLVRSPADLDWKSTSHFAKNFPVYGREITRVDCWSCSRMSMFSKLPLERGYSSSRWMKVSCVTYFKTNKDLGGMI